MATKVKCLVRSKIKGVPKADEAKFTIGKIVSVDPDGEYGSLIRDGVLQPIEGAEDDDDAGGGDGSGGDAGGKKAAAATTSGRTQRGGKLADGGKSTDGDGDGGGGDT